MNEENQCCKPEKIMTTSYFTFGQCHAHAVNGITFDKDCVVEITAEDPRQTMVDTFGAKWSMQYDEMPPETLRHFPRGIIKLKT